MVNANWFENSGVKLLKTGNDFWFELSVGSKNEGSRNRDSTVVTVPLGEKVRKSIFGAQWLIFGFRRKKRLGGDSTSSSRTLSLDHHMHEIIRCQF